MWFRGNSDSAGWTAGLNDLKVSSSFDDSMILFCLKNHIDPGKEMRQRHSSSYPPVSTLGDL